MAGKTIRGVGDEEEQARLSREAAPLIADEDDARSLHSGPTVVDDAKVAEVLKKLRSLDRPTGGVAEVVLDSSSSEPTRLDSGEVKMIDTGPAINLGPRSGTKADPGSASLQDIMYPLQRPTAIGRSLATPVVGQPVTIPADAARGTLFGRSIHLPDVNAPDDVSVELSSGSVQIEGAPTPSQPFPLADRPAIAIPAPTGPPGGPMAKPSAFADPDRRFHTPYDPETQTQVVPTRSKWKPVVALIGGVALVGAGWFGWKEMHREDASPPPPPPQAATPPAIVPLPSPAATTPAPAEPAAAPADEPNPATKEATAKAEPAKADPAKAEPAKADPAKAEAPKKAPVASPSAPAPASERRTPAKAAAPSDEPRPPASRPSRSRRRAPAAPVAEDPDDTLPPSL